MSTDRENVINVVMEGVGVPATGIVPEGMPGYLPDQTPVRVRPRGAPRRSSPASATCRRSRSGTTPTRATRRPPRCSRPAGRPPASTSSSRTTSGERTSTCSPRARRATPRARRSSAWAGSPDYPSMDNFLYPLFHSSQSATMYTFYNNPEFDDLVMQARQTTDETQRWNLYHAGGEAHAHGRAVHPALLLPRSFRVTNNRIGGFVHDPMGADRHVARCGSSTTS